MFLGLVLAGAESQLRRYRLDERTQAKCLDGSVPSYFMQLLDPANLVIYLEGGNLCIETDQESTLAACKNRSGTWLGSSNFQNSTLVFDYDLLSSDSNRNPLYYNYTKVYIRYCDGSLYSGYRAQPSIYNETKLYFRGAINFIEAMKQLKASGLGSKAVALTGTSAGAIGASLWSDYVTNLFAGAQCYLIVDSGLFPYFDGPKGNPFQAVVKFMGPFVNSERPDLVQQNCTDDCFYTAAIIRRLKIPHLLIQSFYDEFNLINNVGISCTNRTLAKCSDSDKALAQRFSTTIRGVIDSFDRSKTSLFGISCVIHGLLQMDGNSSYTIPSGSGFRIRQAIVAWRERKQLWAQDQVSWPDNAGCANLSPSEPEVK